MDKKTEPDIRYVDRLKDTSIAIRGLIKKIFERKPEKKITEVRVKTQKQGDNYVHPITLMGEHPLAQEYRARLESYNIQHMQENGIDEHESYVLLG